MNEIKKSIWLFASYSWQGNPKALYLYMRHHHPDKICLWAADNAEQARELMKLGVATINVREPEATEYLANCDVYVTENFREYYPKDLNKDAVVLNMWHGVGLKPVEIGIGPSSEFSTRIARKFIKYFNFYRQNHLFLSTSEKMTERFVPDMKLVDSQIIKGAYPRNLVYQDANLRTYDFEAITGYDPKKFKSICIYAPTWRRRAVLDSFSKLIPDLGQLAETLKTSKTLLIIKVHPFMREDPSYTSAKQAFDRHPNILFWPDEYDIYEAFDLISQAIVDYSSIFYDLLAAGVKSFIRYVPDYDEHLADEGFTDDYWSLTTGAIAKSFNELTQLIAKDQKSSPDINRLFDYFFGYSRPHPKHFRNAGEPIPEIETLIAATNVTLPLAPSLPTLYSFDIFDTLVRRKSISPIAPFYHLEQSLRYSDLNLPSYLVENFTEVRRSCERAARSFKRDTCVERESDTLEVTFKEIYERMQEIYGLTNEQVAYLQNKEMEYDAALIEPHQLHLDSLKRLVAAGETVILISDMYLPKERIMDLIGHVDPVLNQLPIFVSSEVGHKKDSGKLFTHIFFELEYEYSQWVHFGDNPTADGTEPRKLGITCFTHTIDKFLPYEANLVEANRHLDGYRVATLMQRYRYKLLTNDESEFNEAKYFSYAYLGPSFVCYVNWSIKDALRRGYKTLYFITRDGILLKQIADLLISKRKLNLKTKLIYGSRKAWRIALSDEEIVLNFTSIYGGLGAIKTFEQFSKASLLSPSELLETVPEIHRFKDQNFSLSTVRTAASSVLLNSDTYLKTIKAMERQRYDNCLEYLRREIDLTEPFAFVEFWGRGVSQARLTEYLSTLAGKSIDNPFYYVKSIWPTQDHSVRHQMSEHEFHFSFLEPALAAVPQTSTTGYERRGKQIVPVYSKANNPSYEDFRTGLLDFASDYAECIFNDEDRLDRGLSSAAYKYLRNNPSDQFICNVYASLKDNHGMYAKVTEYAPALTEAQIKGATVRPLNQYTKSLPISLARSSDQVRASYKAANPGKPLPSKTLQIFPKNPRSNYVSFGVGDCFFALQDLKVYQCATFRPDSHVGVVLPRRSVAKVLEYVWTDQGVPRILTEYGYVTAHLRYVSKAGQIVLLKPITIEGQNGTAVQFAPNVPIETSNLAKIDTDLVSFDTAQGPLHLSPSDFIVVRTDIDQYQATVERGVVAFKEVRFYRSLHLVEKNAIDGLSLQPNTWIQISGVEWTEKGTPVLKTSRGYITAHRDSVREARKDIGNYLFRPRPVIKLIQPVSVYSSTNFDRRDKTGEKLPKGTILRGTEIAWSTKNTPRLKLRDNNEPRYISANLKNIMVVREDIEQYYHNEVKKLLILHDLEVYKTVEFDQHNVASIKLKAGTFVTPVGIAWSKMGTPRISLDQGYISANRNFVQVVRGDIESYHYQRIKRVKLANKLNRYSDVGLSQKLDTLDAGTLLQSCPIAWTDKGTPRIVFNGGFISARRSNFLKSD